MTVTTTYSLTGTVHKMAFTTARLNAAVNAALTTATHVQLHTGAPGPAGTANIAAGVARAALTKPSASGGTATCTAKWAIPAAGGPFTHFSLWTALTGGTFDGDGVLTPAESFTGSGELSLTLPVTGS